jgi:hypothetical protein
MHVLLGSSGVVKRVLTLENALENANGTYVGTQWC